MATLTSPSPNLLAPNPVVSVIVPTYNYANYLREAVASVQAQTLTDWECVIVDDGSTDDTPRVAASLAASDARIRCVAQPNRGPSAARNHGLAVSTGEFIQFLDADDLLAPEKLGRQASILTEQTDVDLVYASCRYFLDGEPSKLRYSFRGPDRPWTPQLSGRGTDLVQALLADNIMVVEAPLIRRRALEDVGGFDPRIRRGEDWDLWIRLALADHVFLYNPDSDGSVLARVHGRSTSQDELAMLRDALRFRFSIRPRLVSLAWRRINHRRIAETIGGIGLLEGFNGSLTEGVRNLLRAAAYGRDGRWLAWAMAMPLLRLPGGRSLYRVARRLRRCWRDRSGIPAP